MYRRMPSPNPLPASGRAVRGKLFDCKTWRTDPLLSSWPASVPAIHVFGARNEGVDARNKSAHDDFGLFDPPRELGFMAERIPPDSPARAGRGRVRGCKQRIPAILTGRTSKPDSRSGGSARGVDDLYCMLSLQCCASCRFRQAEQGIR
jgi:hypothetical protein